MLSKKQKLCALAMCFVALVLAWLLVILSSDKAQWERWLTELEATNGESPAALVGFKDAGSNAVPFLVRSLTNPPAARASYVDAQKKLPKKVSETLPEWSPINFMRHQRAVLQALAAIGPDAREAAPAVMWALTNIVTAYYSGGPATAYDPHVRSNALVTLRRIDRDLAQSRELIESEIRAGRYGQGGLVRETADRVLAGIPE
jgi:hypothetical protein